VRSLARAIAGRLLSDYWNGWLYAIPLSPRPPDSQTAAEISCRQIFDNTEIVASRYPEIQRHAWVRDQDCWSFGAFTDGELIGICWVHARETYRRRGGIFELGHDEAEIAQITTAEACRGRGVATTLIRFAAGEMAASGFHKLYARIWRDNVSSIGAFARAGWKPEKRFVSFSVRMGKPRSLVVRLPMH